MLTLSTPVFYSFELDFACNNQCQGCSNISVFNQTGQINANGKINWKRVIEILKPHIYQLRLTGGEPTLHPDFHDIINLLHQLNIPFTIFSNGRWQDSRRLINSLKDTLLQFNGLLISLHGANSQSHDYFTGVVNSFDETVENIRLATQGGLNVATNTVITKNNFNEIEDIVILSESIGANHAVFNRFIGNNISALSPSENQLQEAIFNIDNLKKAGKPVKFGNCIPRCFYMSSSTGCLAGIAYCTIDPWGNVRPCNHAPLVLGNLLEKSIEEIWRSEQLQRWNEMIPIECYDCSEFSRCHGGCRAMALLTNTEKDTLIGKPIITRNYEKKKKKQIFYEGLIPIKKFKIRQENFGYLLISRNRILSVTEDSKQLIDKINGKTTLKKIQTQFGNKGLEFIIQLYNLDLIGLESKKLERLPLAS